MVQKGQDDSFFDKHAALAGYDERSQAYHERDDSSDSDGDDRDYAEMFKAKAKEMKNEVSERGLAKRNQSLPKVMGNISSMFSSPFGGGNADGSATAGKGTGPGQKGSPVKNISKDRSVPSISTPQNPSRDVTKSPQPITKDPSNAVNGSTDIIKGVAPRQTTMIPVPKEIPEDHTVDHTTLQISMEEKQQDSVNSVVDAMGKVQTADNNSTTPGESTGPTPREGEGDEDVPRRSSLDAPDPSVLYNKAQAKIAIVKSLMEAPDENDLYNTREKNSDRLTRARNVTDHVRKTILKYYEAKSDGSDGMNIQERLSLQKKIWRLGNIYDLEAGEN